jgi:hypothetical protein
VGGAEVVETPTLTLSTVPTKLVQLFVDPCYYSLCTISDYVGRVSGLSPQLAGDAGNYRLWRLPLAVQLPSLALLPLCLAAVAALVVWAVRHRPVRAETSRSIRLLAEMSIAATGIVVGYAASTLTGAPHLRYGFARDFLLPALLTGVVATALGAALVWRLLERRRNPRMSSEILFIAATVVVAAVAVGGAAVARVDGLPRIESRQLGNVTYVATCRGEACEVSIAATTTSGRALGIPERSVLTFGCGSDAPRFTQYESSPSAGFRLREPCRDARLVAAWPTVMGLPPGSFELDAVTVRNA